jgi:hypothetical protein
MTTPRPLPDLGIADVATLVEVANLIEAMTTVILSTEALPLAWE